MASGASRATLVLLVGAPGTGKSRLGRRLASTLRAQVVETDRVRKQLFAEPRYTGGEHAAVYGWCHTLIRTCLAAGQLVVFDATNLEERVRRRAYDIADTTGARLVIVWVTCPPNVVQERLLRRRDGWDAEDVSDADWRIYLELKRKAEPIRRPHIVVNTAADADTGFRRVLAQIQADA